MKQITCQCRRVIEVEAGFAGEPMMFPKDVYICECGIAYLPQNVGCMGGGFEDSTEPIIFSALEYAHYKELELAAAICLKFPKNEAVCEIPAKVISETNAFYSLSEKKEQSLMIVIEKMIAGYQNTISPDEEIFKLFEKAKSLHHAKTETDFQRALKDL